MESQQFDRLTQMITEVKTRRGALRVLSVALFGVSAAVIAEHDADAKKRRRRRHRRKDGGGGGKTPANQCPVASVCNTEANVCGSVAGGGECTCERSVEGNNICVNSGAGCPIPLLECTSTSGPEATSCRNLPGAGFHFFCQENKTNGSGVKCGCGQTTTTGRVCMPECDNPS